MKFLVEETPSKVMSLLGVAMASMAFLFVVSASNASFSKTENPLPDLFGPANVVASLDQVSHSFAYFVDSQLIAPTKQSYAVAAESLAWIGQTDTEAVADSLGLSPYTPPTLAVIHVHPRVAGASIVKSLANTPTGFTISRNDNTPQ